MFLPRFSPCLLHFTLFEICFTSFHFVSLPFKIVSRHFTSFHFISNLFHFISLYFWICFTSFHLFVFISNLFHFVAFHFSLPFVLLYWATSKLSVYWRAIQPYIHYQFATPFQSMVPVAVTWRFVASKITAGRADWTSRRCGRETGGIDTWKSRGGFCSTSGESMFWTLCRWRGGLMTKICWSIQPCSTLTKVGAPGLPGMPDPLLNRQRVSNKRSPHKLLTMCFGFFEEEIWTSEHPHLVGNGSARSLLIYLMNWTKKRRTRSRRATNMPPWTQDFATRMPFEKGIMWWGPLLSISHLGHKHIYPPFFDRGGQIPSCFYLVSPLVYFISLYFKFVSLHFTSFHFLSKLFHVISLRFTLFQICFISFHFILDLFHFISLYFKFVSLHFTLF